MGVQSRHIRWVASAALALAAAQSARANLIVDFRFSSNPTDTQKQVVSGADVDVQIWATILGSGTLGIGSVPFRALSQQISGGAFTDGGVSVALTDTAAGHFSNGSTSGTIQEVTGDSLMDLGQSLASTVSTPPDARWCAQKANNSATSPGYYTSQGGWTSVTGGASVQLGTFTVHVGTIGFGTTRYIVGAPASPVNLSALWFENATSQNGISGAKQSSASTFLAGTSVTFQGIIVDKGPTYALTTQNNATVGTAFSKSLVVIGSNGNYYDPGPGSNYAPANSSSTDYAIANATLGVGNQSPVLVLVDFDLGAGTAAGLGSILFNDGGVVPIAIVGPGDFDPLNQRSLLLSQYPSFNVHASHVVLFEFDNVSALPNGLHFGYDAGFSGPLILQVVVVPEPGTVGSLTLGAAALVRRRRRVGTQGFRGRS